MPIEFTRTLTFHLASKLYRVLKQAAELNHLTDSDVARHRLEGIEIKPPRRRVVADELLLRQLVRVGSNLNQQTRVLH